MIFRSACFVCDSCGHGIAAPATPTQAVALQRQNAQYVGAWGRGVRPFDVAKELFFMPATPKKKAKKKTTSKAAAKPKAARKTKKR